MSAAITNVVMYGAYGSATKDEISYPSLVMPSLLRPVHLVRDANLTAAWVMGQFELNESLKEFLGAPQCPFRPGKKDVLHPIFVWRLRFTHKEQLEADPICVLADLQILPRFACALLKRLDALKNRLFIASLNLGLATPLI